MASENANCQDDIVWTRLINIERSSTIVNIYLCTVSGIEIRKKVGKNVSMFAAQSISKAKKKFLPNTVGILIVFLKLPQH